MLSESARYKRLVDKLRVFNKIVYVKAKHTWGPPLWIKVHLFDKREAIIMYFIARKLGKLVFDEGKLDLPKELALAKHI